MTVTGLTAAEARTAQWALEQANTAREAAGLEPFANAKAMLEDHILNVMLPSWQAAEAAATIDLEAAKERWKLSTDAQRTAALAELAPLP